MDEPHWHPLANIFPMITGAEFTALCEDIRAYGLREPLWYLDDKILDGRNRDRACTAINLPIPEDMRRQFIPEQHGDPLRWVISKNLKRRHLDESQRAWVAAKIAILAKGYRQIGKFADLPTQDEAAQMMNVSARSVRNAAMVRDKAEPELRAAVESGALSVSLGATATKLSRKLQRQVAKKAGTTKVAVVRKVVNSAKRKAHEKALGKKQIALPNKKYGVILADPEWRFETYSEEGMNAAAGNHYATSPIELIKARPVASIAATDCALFLWATAPMLTHALEVMEAWGFLYKTSWVWVKNKAGTGYWNRNRHELLLLGTRGQPPAPALGTQWDSVIEARAGRHSQKPEESYQLIEEYFPTLPKIELNQRKPRQGWDGWGAEVVVPKDHRISRVGRKVSTVGDGADQAGKHVGLVPQRIDH